MRTEQEYLELAQAIAKRIQEDNEKGRSLANAMRLFELEFPSNKTMTILESTFNKHENGDYEFIQVIIGNEDGRIIYTLQRRDQRDMMCYFLREDFANYKTLCKFYDSEESFDKAILRLQKIYKNHPNIKLKIGSNSSFKIQP